MVYGIFLFLLFYLFVTLASKILYPRIKPPVEKYNLNEVRERYRKAETLSALSFFIVTPILTFLLIKGFYTVYQTHIEIYKTGSVYLLPYTIAVFVLPSVFLAILLVVLSSDLISNAYRKIKRFGDEEYKVYLYDLYTRQLFGKEFDYRVYKVLYIVVVSVVFIISAPAVFLAFDYYTRITSTSIYTNDYLSIGEKAHSFTDVSKILWINTLKNKQTGGIEPTSSYYEVIFKDGYSWNTLNLPINKYPLEREVVEYISSKSNIPVKSETHGVDNL
jgi:hypothetical protein